jgi:hypothetical protein
MPIVVSDEGYYQVDDYWDLQDVSQNSINYKMFRGWNERRLLLGLPIYKYEGSQMQEVGSLDDARIMPGANMQHTNLWRRIQEEAFFSSTIQNTDGTAYSIGLGSKIPIEIENSNSFIVDNTAISSSGEIDERYGLFYRQTKTGAFSEGLIERGDIIGPWIINDILKRLWFYRQAIIIPRAFFIRLGGYFPTNALPDPFANQVGFPPFLIGPEFNFGFYFEVSFGLTEVYPQGFQVGNYVCVNYSVTLHSRTSYTITDQVAYSKVSAIWFTSPNLASPTEQGGGIYNKEKETFKSFAFDSADIIGAEQELAVLFDLFTGSSGLCGAPTFGFATKGNLLFEPQLSDLPPST